MCDSKYNFASFSLSRARAFSFFAVCWQCLQCFIANSHLNAPDNTIVSRMLLSSSVYLSRALAFLPPLPVASFAFGFTCRLINTHAGN